MPRAKLTEHVVPRKGYIPRYPPGTRVFAISEYNTSVDDGEEDKLHCRIFHATVETVMIGKNEIMYDLVNEDNLNWGSFISEDRISTDINDSFKVLIKMWKL